MSKQKMFESIISSTIKRVRENILAGALDEFEQRMSTPPPYPRNTTNGSEGT